MSEQCKAAANIKGEHVPCDLTPPHTGWGHSNRNHELIWIGADEHEAMFPNSRTGES